MRDLLRFLFYLDILKKLLLLQRNDSKYMYARCLNFPCFINYLAACMHAFSMFCLYVSLEERFVCTSLVDCTHMKYMYTVTILIKATNLMHKSKLSTNSFENNHFGQKYQKQNSFRNIRRL